MTQRPRHPSAPEWPTLGLILATYALWAMGTTVIYDLSPVLAVIVTGIAITQFSSLQHEVLHGHPFQRRWLNEALVFPALCPTVPYGRFRDTHLAHHHDPNLTDPYDDPESNYLDPKVWAALPVWEQRLYRVNNTLLGRIILGPIFGTILWLRSEVARRHDPAVRRDWLLHLGGIGVLLLWLIPASMDALAYAGAVYVGVALLKIRTFLEHRAHHAARARTVIVEDRGPLALLFLNNNLHVVHHAHPQVPWYRLPAMFAANRDHYLRRNDGYVYRSYGQIFRAYLLRAKDPVPHPLMAAADPATDSRQV